MARRLPRACQRNRRGRRGPRGAARSSQRFRNSGRNAAGGRGGLYHADGQPVHDGLELQHVQLFDGSGEPPARSSAAAAASPVASSSWRAAPSWPRRVYSPAARRNTADSGAQRREVVTDRSGRSHHPSWPGVKGCRLPAPGEVAVEPCRCIDDGRVEQRQPDHLGEETALGCGKCVQGFGENRGHRAGRLARAARRYRPRTPTFSPVRCAWPRRVPWRRSPRRSPAPVRRPHAANLQPKPFRHNCKVSSGRNARGVGIDSCIVAAAQGSR